MVNLSASIEEKYVKALDEEAEEKRRNRSQQLEEILEQRYGLEDGGDSA